MIFLIQLEFNKHFYRALASSASAAVVSSRQLFDFFFFLFFLIFLLSHFFFLSGGPPGHRIAIPPNTTQGGLKWTINNFQLFSFLFEKFESKSFLIKTKKKSRRLYFSLSHFFLFQPFIYGSGNNHNSPK